MINNNHNKSGTAYNRAYSGFIPSVIYFQSCLSLSQICFQQTSHIFGTLTK